MRRAIGLRVQRLLALAVLALVSVSPLSAQRSQGDKSDAERGPRFLLAGERGALPRALDPSRVTVLARRISLTLEGVTLKEALTTVAHEASLDLAYSADVLPAGPPVHFRAEGMSVAAVLTELLLDARVDVIFSRDGKVNLVRRQATIGLATGVLTGRVIERGTNTPVVAAAVTVTGTGLTRLTDDKGQYRIANVPAGEQEITVRRLGFGQGARRVRIADGETVTADFTMARVATALTEVVTTATGERSRLEVGNAIGTIKADSVVQTNLIRNMSDLLTARTPGVVVTNSTGLVGAPSTIRIRGVASISLSNDPIIILDGVRMAPASNKGLATTIGSTSFAGLSGSAKTTGQQAPSRLDDIDPNTIESIDVLRGPSASSLYGTDAAAGVIVIKTKKGVAGPWRFSLLADQGTSHIPGTFQPTWVGFGHLIAGQSTEGNFATVGEKPVTFCWLAPTNVSGGGGSVADGTCVQDSVRSYQPLNDPRLTTLGTGVAQNLSANFSGGTEQLREFLSLRLSDATGITKLSDAEQDRIARMWGAPPPSWMRHPNTEQDINGASRTTLRVANDLDISFTANGLYRNTLASGTGTIGDGNNVFPGNDNEAFTGGSSGMFGFVDTLRYLPAEAQRARSSSVAKRGYGAVTASYTPLSWLVVRGTVGGDYTLRTDESLLRSQDCTTVLFPAGCASGHTNERGETFVVTTDIGAQATWEARRGLSLRTSIGEQYGHTTFYDLNSASATGTTLAFGTELLTPSPITTTTGAQLYRVVETQDESATAGWYMEETAALRDKMYLTAAFRQDVASAFGRNVNAKAPVYPKFSVSWLLSDESFFPKTTWVSSFRVRAAYGHSGQEALQSAVLNNFRVTNALVDGTAVAGIYMSGLGNPSLRPERTAEAEGGVDLSFLENERIHVEATIYRKLSHDVITALAQPVSFGAAGIAQSGAFSESVNLGSVENRGWELATTAKLVDSRTIAWQVMVNASWNINRLVQCAVVGVGCVANTNGRGNFTGYPLNSFFGHRLLGYADVNGDGILSYPETIFDKTPVFLGTTTPESELTYVNSLSLFGGAWQVNATLDQVNGQARTTSIPAQQGFANLVPRALVDPTSSIEEQAAILQATSNRQFGWFYRANTLRVSELSVTWNVPKAAAVRLLRARTAALTFAGRNLAYWTTYARKDPNVDTGAGNDAGVDTGTSIPQPRTWTFRINLGY